jgi:hypothetical protein
MLVGWSFRKALPADPSSVDFGQRRGAEGVPLVREST